MMEAVDRIRTFRELRKGSLLTQQQTADALGVSLSTVSRIECGRMEVSKELHDRINALFEEETLILKCGDIRKNVKRGRAPKENEKVLITQNEKRFLRTCWNMRESLRHERMIVRDMVDATFEFMESCEAITYLYKWSKIGFYHYAKGGVVDQGYFLWDKLPPKYRRILSQNE